MRFPNSYIVKFLLLPSIFALASGSPASPAPTPLLPPSKFQLRIITSPSEGYQTLGFLSFPAPPLEGALPRVIATPSPSPVYFNQKNTAGLGWISNGPVFYAPGWDILSWSLNSTSSHSKIYLDDTTNNGAGRNGFVPLIVQATRMFGDRNLYFKGIVTGLGGGETTTDPATFSWDKKERVLFVSTGTWSKQTVYLQIVPYEDIYTL